MQPCLNVCQLRRHFGTQSLFALCGFAPLANGDEVQIGGIVFLLGGILMFVFQAWSWRRRQGTKVSSSTFVL